MNSLLWLESQGLTEASRVHGLNLRLERGPDDGARSNPKGGNSLMRVYEVLFIIAPNIEESDIDTLVTQLSDVATTRGRRSPRSIELAAAGSPIPSENSTKATTLCSPSRGAERRSPKSNAACASPTP